MRHIKAFGIPEVKSFGHNQNFNILIMELLGPSLENLFQLNNQKFSLKTVCMLGIQMLDRIEYIHSRKIIHRDIKPDNFVIGRKKNSHVVYVLDFGLAKKFWSSSHECHIPFTTGKKLTGTARYASINALSGYEQGRRDDLESIAYILVYFLKGSLPWQGIKINNKEDKYKKICEKKRKISTKELCEGLPIELETFISYVKNLDFAEVPDYNYLKELLKTILKNNNLCLDYYFDWDKECPDIEEDNMIYTNDYHIEYNGKNKWLNNKKDKFNKKKESCSNVYSKPIVSLNLNPLIKNTKTITSISTNFQQLKTADNSNSDSRINENNYIQA